MKQTLVARTGSGDGEPSKSWKAERVPVAVVMITLNEGHNLEAVIRNLAGWAQEVFVVDSCGVEFHRPSRRHRQAGQRKVPLITKAPELTLHDMDTMRQRNNNRLFDPEERLTDALKESIETLVTADGAMQVDGILMDRRLWFMGKVLPVHQTILRLWQTGSCRFTDVDVNEHPLVSGRPGRAKGYLQHYDSPDLYHWVAKQNRYTTAEAVSQFKHRDLAAPARLFGSSLERRMWIKKHFWKFPGRYSILFFYHLVFLGAWRAERVSWIRSHLWTEVYRLWEYKRFGRFWRTPLASTPQRIPSTRTLGDLDSVNPSPLFRTVSTCR